MATLPALVPFQVPQFNLGETFTQMARLSAYDQARRASELEQEEKRTKRESDRLWRSTIAEAFPTADPRAPAGLTAAQPQAQPQMPAQALPTGGLAGPQAISQGPSTMGPPGMASQVPFNQPMDVNPQTGEWSTPGGLSAPPVSPMASGGLTQPPPAMPPQGAAMPAPGQPPLQGGGLTVAQPGQSVSTGPGGASTGTLGGPQPQRPLEALVPGLMPMPDMRAVQRAFAIDPERTSQWYGAYLTQRKGQLEEVTRNNELIHQVTGAMLENPAYYKQGLEYLRDQGVPVPKNMPQEYNPALVKMHFDMSGKRLDPLQQAQRENQLAQAAHHEQQARTEASTRGAVERFRASEGGQPGADAGGTRTGAAQPSGSAAPPTPGPQASPADQARWQSLLQLADETADKEGVPRALVRAVIKQESNWDINAVGDGGKAKGWFQLHEGAAKDAGIDPAKRHDPELNVQGGIRYLKLKLQQAGGDVDKALKLYNGGGDPNYVQNVRRWLKEEAPAGGAGGTTTPAAASAVPAATSARIAELRQQIAAKERRATEAANIGTPLAGAATQLRSEINDLQAELVRLEEPQRALEKQTVLQPGELAKQRAAAEVTLEAKMNEPIGAENAVKMNLPPQTKWKDVPQDVKVLDRPSEGAGTRLGAFKASHEGITRVIGMLDQPGAKSIVGTLLSSEDNAAFRRAAGQWISSVTPAERKFAAALVAEIAGIRNTISGQAVSAQEAEFLKPMLPSVADPDVGTVRAKLEVLQEWIARKHEGERGQMEEMGFRTPKPLVTGGASAAGTPPPGALTPAQERLRQKYGG
jgi:soluble lytic murein transglycosylase-like protein